MFTHMLTNMFTNMFINLFIFVYICSHLFTYVHIYCQAQRSWLALILVYYRPTAAAATRNSLKMANLAHIEGRMDLNIPIPTS